MEIRNTELADIGRVMEIYNHARQYMRDNNNLEQWVNGYPGIRLITQDIEERTSYVCLDGSKIVGVFRFAIEKDPTYARIDKGSWLNEEPYGVIHRIASASHKRGVAAFCLNWCLSKCTNIRIDTHRDNLPMQNFLLKHGFNKCGIIYIADGSERLAYQKAADYHN